MRKNVTKIARIFSGDTEEGMERDVAEGMLGGRRPPPRGVAVALGRDMSLEGKKYIQREGWDNRLFITIVPKVL